MGKNNRYEGGIIYKMVCKDPNITDIYIGYTCNIYREKYNHKLKCNNPKYNTHNSYKYRFIRDHGGILNWDLIQIIAYPCENKRQLEAQQHKFIEKYKPSLNSELSITRIENYEERHKIDDTIYKVKLIGDEPPISVSMNEPVVEDEPEAKKKEVVEDVVDDEIVSVNNQLFNNTDIEIENTPMNDTEYPLDTPFKIEQKVNIKLLDMEDDPTDLGNNIDLGKDNIDLGKDTIDLGNNETIENIILPEVIKSQNQDIKIIPEIITSIINGENGKESQETKKTDKEDVVETIKGQIIKSQIIKSQIVDAPQVIKSNDKKKSLEVYEFFNINDEEKSTESKNIDGGFDLLGHLNDTKPMYYNDLLSHLNYSHRKRKAMEALGTENHTISCISEEDPKIWYGKSTDTKEQIDNILNNKYKYRRCTKGIFNRSKKNLKYKNDIKRSKKLKRNTDLIKIKGKTIVVLAD